MSLGYSQRSNNMEAKNYQRYPFGKNFELKVNEVIHLADLLSVKLVSFSHKHARTGGPTKATAYLTVSMEGESDTIQLSVHGGGSNSAQFDRYDSLHWKGYEFKLTKFDYDKSIELMIIKE